MTYLGFEVTLKDELWEITKRISDNCHEFFGKRITINEAKEFINNYWHDGSDQAVAYEELAPGKATNELTVERLKDDVKFIPLKPYESEL